MSGWSCVTRLSSVSVTLSVWKNARSARVTAPLWQACADGYSGKFGVGRSGCQVGSSCRERLIRTPEPVVELRVEACDHRVAAGDVRHSEHPGRLELGEPARGCQPEHAVVPLPEVVIGPEERLRRLIHRPDGAVRAAERL